jgi:ribonuclease BN (tRNA processing enzyme)
VTVGHAQHAQPYLECLALRLDTKEGSLCYTGDTGLSDNIVTLAAGCDLLIAMNHYYSGTEPSAAYRAATGNHRDCALMAQRAGAKVLVLTHLLEQIDQPTIREQIIQEVRQVYDGKVVWGADLMRLGLAGTAVGAIERKG